jgi:hypothetical protein
LPVQTGHPSVHATEDSMDLTERVNAAIDADEIRDAVFG